MCECASFGVNARECILIFSPTFTDAKRLIGREFNDPDVQKDMKLWPFKVVDCNTKPKIEVEYLVSVPHYIYFCSHLNLENLM